MLSLVTAVGRGGFGPSWYGIHKSFKEAGFMSVFPECALGEPDLERLVPRVPQPQATLQLYGFLELHGNQGNLSTGGNAILAQNVKAAADFIGRYENARDRAKIASRFQRSG